MVDEHDEYGFCCDEHWTYRGLDGHLREVRRGLYPREHNCVVKSRSWVVALAESIYPAELITVILRGCDKELPEGQAWFCYYGN